VRVLARQELAANDRFDVGEGTRTDIAQAQSRLAQAVSGLAQADAQLQSSRAAYTRIIGHPPVDLKPVPRFELPRDLPTAIYLARENNPQLLAAYFNEDAAVAAINVAKAASRPTISLNGTAGGTRNQVIGISEADQMSIAAQISIPIFSGGLNRSRVRQAKHAKTRLAFEVRDTELAVDQTIAQIWAQLDAARRTLTSSLKQVDAAEIAFEGVDLEQKVGTRTTLDVLDAEQEVLNAKLAAADAQRGVNAATFQMLTTLGVFDVDGIQLPVDEYDPRDNFEHVKYSGVTAIVDKYVPELLQDTVRELGEVPGDMSEVAVRLTKAAVLPQAAGKIISQIPDIPQVPLELKKKIDDRITFETPDYHPLKDVPLPEIDTDSKRQAPKTTSPEN
jgi:outer membrane protein